MLIKYIYNLVLICPTRTKTWTVSSESLNLLESHSYAHLWEHRLGIYLKARYHGQRQTLLVPDDLLGGVEPYLVYLFMLVYFFKIMHI